MKHKTKQKQNGWKRLLNTRAIVMLTVALVVVLAGCVGGFGESEGEAAVAEADSQSGANEGGASEGGSGGGSGDDPAAETDDSGDDEGTTEGARADEQTTTTGKSDDATATETDIEPSESQATESESNDDQETADPVALGDTFSGTISEDAEFDWIGVKGVEMDQNVTIEISSESGELLVSTYGFTQTSDSSDGNLGFVGPGSEQVSGFVDETYLQIRISEDFDPGSDVTSTSYTVRVSSENSGETPTKEPTS